MIDFNRRLGNIEHAWALNDLFAPLSVVLVLRLANGPSPVVLQHAFNILQQHQPLLNVHLDQEKSHFFFRKSLRASTIPVKRIKRENDSHWQRIVEDALNSRIDTATAPLARCTYLYTAGTAEKSEIIFSCHHGIIDSASGILFFHHFLSLCKILHQGKTVTGYTPLPPLPAVEDMYPAAYKGMRRRLRVASFMIRQFGKEIPYRWALRNRQQIHIERPTRCQILTMPFSKETTTALVKCSRRKRVTINSVLNAAMLLAMAKHVYKWNEVPMRGMVFADLRPHLKPPLSGEILGCCISMLQYTVALNAEVGFWKLARLIENDISQSTKRGEKFIAGLMSKHLIQLLIRLKSIRMGTTALSYLGAVNLQKRYGPTQVLGLHGFVSNNVLGPELAGFAKIVSGRLSWDILYLDSDMDRALAQGIADEILVIIESAVK